MLYKAYDEGDFVSPSKSIKPKSYKSKTKRNQTRHKNERRSLPELDYGYNKPKTEMKNYYINLPFCSVDSANGNMCYNLVIVRAAPAMLL